MYTSQGKQNVQKQNEMSDSFNLEGTALLTANFCRKVANVYSLIKSHIFPVCQNIHTLLCFNMYPYYLSGSILLQNNNIGSNALSLHMYSVLLLYDALIMFMI